MSDNPIEAVESHLNLHALQKKLGPLPVWGWGLILGAATVIGIIIYRKRAATAAETAATVTVTGTDNPVDPNAAADAAATSAAAYQQGITDGTGLLGSTLPPFSALPAPTSLGTDNNSVVPSTGGFAGAISGSRAVSTGLAAAATALPAIPALTSKPVAAATKTGTSVTLTTTAKKTSKPPITPATQAMNNFKQNAPLIAISPVVGLTLTGIENSVNQVQNVIGTVSKLPNPVTTVIGAISKAFTPAPAKKAAPKPAPKPPTAAQKAATAKATAKASNATAKATKKVV